MDPYLFQFEPAAALNSTMPSGMAFGTPCGTLDARAAATSIGHSRKPEAAEKWTANSRNLDVLRSFAVLLVVGFHLAKFFNWQFERLRVTDFGLLGVMLFFVHTTLVLMFSLERQRNAGGGASLFVPFLIRRCFRIYPLAILVVTFAFLFHIPSDLQFGGFHLLHQSAWNFLANLLLIQNVALQKANPGVLWSLPLELQMYLALPALFLFASRIKSAWGMIAFWWAAVALWFGAGFSAGVLPLSEGGIRSPMEALLKFTRFAPCFLPGLVAYKLWRGPRYLPAWVWPAFLVLCGTVFLWLSGSQPIETGWFICFAIGLTVSFFREMRENPLTWLTKRIARYSYGIYLLHYFAIWVGFQVCHSLNVTLQIAIFAAVLISLSVLLYHTVEAPLIAAGVSLSEKFKEPELACGWKGSPPERPAQIFLSILILAFFLIAAPAPALAQSVGNRNGLPSIPLQTPAEINQRLQQANEKLAVSGTEFSDGESRLGPDDLLNITVFEAPEMNSTVRVAANGEISIQLLGAVRAAGLTPKELESVLQEKLRGTYMKDPHVGVFVQELQSHPVSVVGAVRMPGVFQIRGTKTVIEVLSMAQGLTDDAGDTVVIMHGPGNAEPASPNGSGRMRPGIAAAPRPEPSAKTQRSFFVPSEKESEIEEINLKNLLDSDESALNVQVRPGDIVKVPRAGIVYVVGEVQKPGGFVLQNNENISVLQALALAQGPTHTSATSRSRIIRTDPSTGKRTEIPMNLGKILSGREPDTYLQPKDIVFVPNSAAKSVLYRGSAAALQTAAGVAIYKW